VGGVSFLPFGKNETVGGYQSFDFLQGDGAPLDALNPHYAGPSQASDRGKEFKRLKNGISGKIRLD
jgi:hypothetical protein